MAWYTNSWMKCRITRMGMKALRWTSKQNPHSTSCFIAFMVGFIRNLLDTYQRHVATTSPTWYTCKVSHGSSTVCLNVSSYPNEIHKYDIQQKFHKPPEVDSQHKWESSLVKWWQSNFLHCASCMCSFDIRICDTVDTIRRAASRTRNAGSSLANWAFVSFQ